MDVVVWILFESVAALGAILGLALFVLLVYWRRSGNVRPLLIGLAVALVLLTVQKLVVTKREHAGQILDAIVADLIKSRTAALAAALAPDFAGDGLDRDQLLAHAASQLRSVQIRWADRTRLEITEAQRDRFVVTADYLTQIVANEFAATPRSGWSLTFVREPDGWKIARLHCLHIDGVSEPEWLTHSRP